MIIYIYVKLRPESTVFVRMINIINLDVPVNPCSVATGISSSLVVVVVVYCDIINIMVVVGPQIYTALKAFD